jgi:uncharacterized protein
MNSDFDSRTDDKLNKVKEQIGHMGKIAVAYSGGVDSTLLLKLAYDIKHDEVVGIYADSPLQPGRDRMEALDVARSIGAKVFVIKNDHLLDIETFKKNPPNRCYYCKGYIFDEIGKKARSLGCTSILDGSNHDDRGDYRPGKKALEERSICSPLQEAGLTKAEIRIISKAYGLPTWDKDAYACLASRIPYNTEITLEKLKQVDDIEKALIGRGYRNVRARHLGKKVRIEVRNDQVIRLKEEINQKELMDCILVAGFTGFEIDPAGYRQGSLNDLRNTKQNR